MVYEKYRSVDWNQRKDRGDATVKINFCPHCGKTLSLVPPNSELLPSRFGFSTNGVSYYFPPKRKITSYTLKPKASYSHYKSNDWHFEGVLNPNIVKHDRIHPGWQIVPVKYAKKRIDKGGVHLYSQNLIFFCSNCKKKLALNYNPVGLWELVREMLTISLLLFLIIYTILVINNVNVSISTLFVGIFVHFLSLLGTAIYAIISLILVMHYRSNFVLTDAYDSLINQKVHFSISSNGLRLSWLKESNIFSIEVNGQLYQIYLEKKDKAKLHMHICGINDEPKIVISFLNQKVKNDGKATLSLWFEGKYIGNAEVIEIYDYIEEKTLPYDAPKTKSKLNWSCDDCGFSNLGTSSECKSCGKYRK